MNGGFTGIDFEAEQNQDNTNNLNNTNNYNPELDNTGMYNTGNINTSLDNTAMYNTGNINTSLDNTAMYNTGNINTNLDNTGNVSVNYDNTTSIPLNNNLDSEVLSNTNTMDLTGVNDSVEENKNIDPTLPNTRGVDSSTTSLDIRMNPVTGEEINVKDLIGDKKEDEVNNEEKLKTVKIEYKPASAWSTFLLILFFIFLIAFVVFLPEIETAFSEFMENRNGGKVVREISTGKLVCTLKTNTSNLDKNYERIFNYENNKLKTSKLTTITRGDASLDEASLTKLSEQCNKIKSGVEGLDGIQISCKLDADKLEEVEVFDYAKYSIDEVSQVYLDNGSSILDLEVDADINIVMTTMRQSGYTCEKQR